MNDSTSKPAIAEAQVKEHNVGRAGARRRNHGKRGEHNHGARQPFFVRSVTRV
jgi:hypothetical protein